MIVRERLQEDRRSVFVGLTESGLQLLADLDDQVRQYRKHDPEADGVQQEDQEDDRDGMAR